MALDVKEPKVIEGTGLLEEELLRRKRAQGALKNAGWEKEVILDSLVEHVIYEDTTMKILWPNRAACESVGSAREELIGRHCYEIWPRRNEPCPDCPVTKAIETGEPQGIEKSTPDGRAWFIRGYPVRDANGDIVGAVEVTLEITERKRAEETLRESEENYRGLVERANDGIAIIQDKLLKYVNPRLEAISGYSTDELIDTPFTDYIDPDELPKVLDRYQRRMAGEEVTPTYELMIKHKDGHKIFVELNAGVTTYQGKPADLVIIRDITERKRAEEEIRHRIDELATLNEIGRAIASTMKLDGLWELIYHQTCRVMEVSAFYIALHDQEKGELRSVIDMLQGEHRPQREKSRRFRKGRTECIIRTRQPLLTRGDVQETYDRLGIVSSDKRAKAFAGVPLIAGDEVIGVLAVQNYERHDAYDEHTIEILSTIAHQAAIAIENARLFKKARGRATQLALINEVGEKAVSILDLDRLMQEATCAIQEKFDYYNVALFLVDTELHEAVMEAVAGGLEHVARGEYRQPLGQGVIGRVITTGRSWLADDVSQDPHYVKGFLGEVSTQSELCVPIRLGDEVIGALDIQSIYLSAFDETDVTAMETLSGQLAIAIQNARLYGDLQAELTERKQAEEALRESEESYRELADSITDVFFAMDKDLKYTYWNKASEDLMGIPAKDAIGKSLYEIFPDTSQTKNAAKAYLDVLRTQQPKTFVNEYQLGGKDFVFEITAYPSRDGLSVFVKDITERERAEKALQRHAEQLEVLRQVGLELAAELDLDTLLHSIASQAVELVEGTAGGLYLYWQERDHLEWAVSIGSHLAPIGSVLRRGEGLSGKVWESGEPIIVDDYRQWEGQAAIYDSYPWSAVIGVPVRWGNEFLGVLNVLADTPRTFSPADAELLSLFANQAAIAIENVRLFETVARGKKEWEETFDSVTDGVYLIDENYTLLRVNRALAESLGTTLKELIGRKCYEVVHGFDEPWSECPLREVLETKQAIVREAEDGRTGRVLQLSVYPRLDDEGNAVGSVHVARDITERRRREREVERRNRELGALNAIAEAVVYSLDLEDVLRRALDKVLEITGFEAGGFGMVDEAREMIVPIVHKGVPRDFLSTFAQPRAGDGVRWQSVKSGDPIFLENLPHDPRVRGREALIEGFRAAAYLPLKIKDKSIGLMALATGQDHHFSPEERSLLMTITSQIAVAMDNAGAYERLKTQNLETISALAAAVEAKDAYTGGHSENVTRFAVVIAESMGLSNDEIEDLQVAALLHDVGKIGIPDGVLNKPARLTSDEFLMIKTHPVIAAEIVGKIEALTHIVPIIRHHHERWDGTGYPDGLKGEKIPLLARILAVADGYDAMTSERPYRGALSEEEVLRELEKGAGSQWDPQVVEVLVNNIVQKKGARSR